MNAASASQRLRKHSNPAHLLIAFAIVAAYICLITYYNRVSQPWEGFRIPDDVKVSRELLAQKMAGPRYFQPVTPTEEMPRPYMAREEALRQVAGIIKERNLPAGSEEILGKVISRLEDSTHSRTTGFVRINSLQLNLALDELTAALTAKTDPQRESGNR